MLSEPKPQSWKSRLRLALALFFGVFLGAFIFPWIRAGEIYDYVDSVDGVHLPSVDALVCLAGGRGRITAAGDLWYHYRERHAIDKKVRIPTLYISGMGNKANLAVLKRQLRAGVRDVVQSEDVLIENESYNTETNARWFAQYAQRMKWKRVVLVTSAYHMRRAQLIFQRVLQGMGLSVQIETMTAFQDPFEPGDWRTSLHGIHVTMQEYLKWLYYRYFWSVPQSG